MTLGATYYVYGVVKSRYNGSWQSQRTKFETARGSKHPRTRRSTRSHNAYDLNPLSDPCASTQQSRRSSHQKRLYLPVHTTCAEFRFAKAAWNPLKRHATPMACQKEFVPTVERPWESDADGAGDDYMCVFSINSKMFSVLLQAVLICTSTWFLWKFFRQTVVKSNLDNIAGPPSPSFWYGHVQQLRDKQGWAFHQELADKYPAVVRLAGPLGRPMLFVHDPRAMHHIAVKEQDIFEEATWFTSLAKRSFGPGLTATHGEHHRKQRKLLNPVFSISHMRHMMPTFYNVTHKLEEAIERRVRDRPAEVNMVLWMGRTALELVGQAGLGYSFDRLTEETADELGDALKSFMPAMAALGVLLQFLPLAEALVPERWLGTLGWAAPIPGLRDLMRISRTLREKSREIFSRKKAALLQGDEALAMQVGEGKDIMSVLLRANMAAAEADRLEEAELVGQMSTLTFAAMDTTSNALSLTLWRLAAHQDVQDRVRQEVREAREANGGSDIGYDDLVSLPYLDAVCRETLRVHVPAPMRFREARKDVVLPLSEPIRGLDGTLMHEIFVPKDTHVFVSISSSNKNPAIWGPDAAEWKPERWLSPLPETVLDAKMPGVYSNLMTFWAGGRACIGFKFSQLEMKVVLAVLLTRFKFELTDKPIYWNLAPVTYPTVKADGSKPELPLKVTMLQ